MFRRIIVEDWDRVWMLGGWALFAWVFVASAWRAIRLPKAAVLKMENLPLEKESHEIASE